MSTHPLLVGSLVLLASSSALLLMAVLSLFAELAPYRLAHPVRFHRDGARR